MSEEELLPKHKNVIIKGIVYSNAFAMVSFAIAYFITNWNAHTTPVLVFSEFVLVPLGMGIIAMKFWINKKKRLVELFPLALLNTIIAIGLSAIFMREGVICLLIVSPLVLGFLWCGVLLGKYIYRKDNTILKSSTFLIFIALFVYDTFSVHTYSNMVSDEIVINAPKEIVWKYVAQHPVNTTAAGYWLFNIGLPFPIQSTVTSDSIGAKRKCIFSNGATFDETVVAYKTDSLFTFDIIKQPDDPEIIGHINIERGQFILKENANGTTTLIGNSWYSLKVFPVWYYDLWAVDITRNVHIRVMEHIKSLAEKDV